MMKFNWIDKLGDWNPQLLRELKGRLKPRNLVIAIAISLLGQFLLFQYFQSQLPVAGAIGSSDYPYYHQYCTGNSRDSFDYLYLCLRDASGNFAINWQQWSLDLFVFQSFIGIFALLVAGTYMLINDLAQEERRGTLNFIRLSPQSSQNLLIGKLLGVPILLYLATLLAVPFHLWTGLTAQIPLIQLLGFYSVVIACGVFFYSTALLYALISNWLVGFQAWLGSGLVLGLLTINYKLIQVPVNSPFTWLRLLTPLDLIPNLTDSSFYRYSQEANLDELTWFNFPIGANIAILSIIALLNFGLWNYWIWQGLQRCFRNSNASSISKRQSYLVTACFEVSVVGFAVPGHTNTYFSPSSKEWLFQHLSMLCFLNFLLFLVLIAALSPHRQVLHDWARYRRQKLSSRKSFWNSSLLKDLIWGEKSPSLVAIAINVGIAVITLGLWILLSEVDGTNKSAGFISLALSASLMMTYATIAQLILFMQTQNRILWAIGVLGAVIFLPPVVLGVLQINPTNSLAFLWLFSVAAPLFAYLEEMSRTTIFMASLAQWGMLALLSLQLTRKLQIAGDSATKALFAGRASLPNSN